MATRAYTVVDGDGNSLGIERADEFDDRDVATDMDAHRVMPDTEQVVPGSADNWETDRPGHVLATPRRGSFPSGTL